MIERTEDLALRRVLPLACAGETVDIRTLTIDESDAWLAKVAGRLSAVDIDRTLAEADTIAAVMTQSSSMVVELVAAYDLEGTLGGIEVIRARMSKGELKAAMDAMVTAEDPFGEAVARSVVEGLGLPSRFLASMVRMRLVEAIASHLESSTNGANGRTASTTPLPEPVGAASSSSSDGPTAKHAKRSG